ncbi:MAG: hypothetical protein GEV06_23525 [Luteitalea sp.]|nr:hypothetical protein [Luteitalea sp.]
MTCGDTALDARLLGFMKFQEFGAHRDPHAVLTRESSSSDLRVGLIPGINARFDGRNIGASVVLRGYDLKHVWLVPRFVVGGTASADLLVTPSASRWVDWYAAVGWERALYAAPDRRGVVHELGLKFRVPVPRVARWATLGYSFGGLRLGYRANGLTDYPRVVVEIGAGVW